MMRLRLGITTTCFMEILILDANFSIFSSSQMFGSFWPNFAMSKTRTGLDVLITNNLGYKA